MTLLDIARLFLFPALVAFSAASDLLTMTIPNRVSLLLVAGFAVMAFAIGMPLQDVMMHVAAGSLVLVVTFVMFAMGWVGGGDAKIAASVALWFGFDHLMPFLIYASVFGGALALLLLQFRKLPLPAMLSRQEWLMRLHTKNGDIPYGIALALGALMIYPETIWMKAAAELSSRMA